MTTTTGTTAIRNAIAAALPGADWPNAATAVLNAMGYRSERTLADQTGSPVDFVRRFSTQNLTTQSERDFLDNAQSVRILFQYTSAEIEAELFDDYAFDTGNARSFLFAAVELDGESYPRGKYAAFARELNKHIQLPSVILFRTASGRVTLAFPHRRANRRDATRDVLGRVSLIREITPADPHRAHLDILAELSLPERLRWMEAHGKPRNFDGLLDAWLAALDTEELNRRFYNDLFRWFERAVKTAKFPASEAVTLSPEEHVIRLITRLMFVWFIKEKGLAADELFTENQVAGLLKDYDRDTGDSYYRAVLQNLFFATLNTEIGQRDFSLENNDTHRDFSRYRYHREIAHHDALLALFSKTPFINGGLFDCLDSFGAGRDGYRVDCFSDVHYGKLSIPNRLFFDESRDAPGLIDLFHHYKFTVEENTPTEQEVALDPELLGKVFENLLAAYNPETRENARKQTGSYYTPRPVVDYMVDEALVAAIAQSVHPESSTPHPELVEGREPTPARHPEHPHPHPELVEGLRRLFDYEINYEVTDNRERVVSANRESIVRAIARLKALDPAVGSGAFPMGILHKLTLALRRLDPDNELWKAEQIRLHGQRAADAFWTADRQERDAELDEISSTFEKYSDSDYGRKLYLIQNSIYGVDIQPVAAQIAKLRFFISLAIEQQPNADPADNYGIRPLPNLETRFVAADSLLGLARPVQLTLGQTQAVRRLNLALAANRERHFHANTRARKLALRRDDSELRRQLADALRQAEFSAADADKVAAWDPYDQNASANWFDPEYMFSVTGGFDVVIANPPYVQLQNDGGRLARQYRDAGYQTFIRTGDLYQLFLERGCQLLHPEQGILAYITSSSWLKAEYGKTTRRYFSEMHTPLRLLQTGKGVFEKAIVDTCILIARMGESDDIGLAVDVDRLPGEDFPPDINLWGTLHTDEDKPWIALSSIERAVMDKMQTNGTVLSEWEVSIQLGIKTGCNKAFVIDANKRNELVSKDIRSSEIIKPMLDNRQILRYWTPPNDLYLIDTHNGYGGVPPVNIEDYPAIKEHLDTFYAQLTKRQDKGKTPYNLRSCAYHEDFSKEKLLWTEISNTSRFTYSEDETYCNNSGFILTGMEIKYLCAMLNSKIVTWFVERVGAATGLGMTRWQGFIVKQIPIPKISAAKQRPFVRLVDRILTAKAADPDADTKWLEWDIDRLVYDLYGLTEEEDTAIERALGLIHQTDEEEDAALLKAMEEADINDPDNFVSEADVMATLRGNRRRPPGV